MEQDYLLHNLTRRTRRFVVNDYSTTFYFIPMPIPVASFTITGGTVTYNGTRSVVTITGSSAITINGNGYIECLVVGGGGVGYYSTYGLGGGKGAISQGQNGTSGLANTGGGATGGNAGAGGSGIVIISYTPV
jgi:hypothetical protein